MEDICPSEEFACSEVNKFHGITHLTYLLSQDISPKFIPNIRFPFLAFQAIKQVYFLLWLLGSTLFAQQVSIHLLKLLFLLPPLSPFSKVFPIHLGSLINSSSPVCHKHHALFCWSLSHAGWKWFYFLYSATASSWQ